MYPLLDLALDPRLLVPRLVPPNARDAALGLEARSGKQHICYDVKSYNNIL